jgi:hypothetical protein
MERSRTRPGKRKCESVPPCGPGYVAFPLGEAPRATAADYVVTQ